MTPPALPPWITPAQHAVLARLVGILDALGAPWVASGGLAGNLHGSAWPLHDIDLDVPGHALAPLAEAFAAAYPHAARTGPRAYEDEEFALELLTLRAGDVEVDLSGAESVVLVAPDGTRHPAPTPLDTYEVRPLAGLAVRVVPLAHLVAYKRTIGRTRDLAELERLG